MAFSSDPALQSNQLPISFDVPEKIEGLRDFLSIHLKRTRDTVNTKEGAIYQLQEQATFQQYYSTNTANLSINRNTYRRVYDLVALNGGPIPATGLPIPLALIGTDQINGAFQATRGYGAATAGNEFVFYPGPDGNVRFNNVTQTITITNTSGVAWTTSTFVFEYTKN